MHRLALIVLIATALVDLCSMPGRSAAKGDQPDTSVERRFDSAVDPAEMSTWMQTMASEPNHVGSAHNDANASTVLNLFKQWGWDAHIEIFQVLYPTPVFENLELLAPNPFKATLTEPPLPGDDTSSRTAGELPAYVAYQGDGDVTAPLLYVNYGTKDDYDTLQRSGISVKGKIVIARYGAVWRGLKAKLAQENGAAGCILYSDPQDDGYAVDDAYPKGPARPAGSFQRGSVDDVTLYPGDPLTPGVGATENANRLKRADAPAILKIPVLPISYADAQHFLAALDGPVVPSGWEGALPITYHIGGGAALAHLQVKSDWRLKPIHDVVAVMRGSAYPDQWILRGNHHDAWVFGASDPMSGQVALLAEAKAIGQLVRQGWRPKRTIVYLSWDAEEPALLGSTEWVETHAAELKQKALVYINSDTNGRGFLNASGSPSLQHLVDSVAGGIIDPETGVSVLERKRAQLQFAGNSPDAGDEDRQAAAIAADPDHDIPIAALGSGSDYSAFLDHLGIAALDLRFGGEGDLGGVYHSAYDTWEYYSRFADPGFRYASALAKVAGHTVLRLADSPLPEARYRDFAEAASGYLEELKRTANERREAAAAQSRLLVAHVYRLAADPEKIRGNPVILKPVPYFDFAPLENAVDRLTRSATNYDAALASGAPLPDGVTEKLFDLTRETDQSLAQGAGLPGRPWYKNLVYAPGRLTGYSVSTFPAVREAIEEERWKDVDRYAAITAAALNAYSDRLDAGIRLIRGASVSRATQ